MYPINFDGRVAILYWTDAITRFFFTCDVIKFEHSNELKLGLITSLLCVLIHAIHL